MKLFYLDKQKCWVFTGPREKAVPAGFTWNRKGQAWTTESDYLAMNLRDYATNPSFFLPYDDLQMTAKAQGIGDLSYGFQIDGIDGMLERFKSRNAVALFDEQGLGKTIQAIKILNHFNHRNVLIVCPAALRLNWERELQVWLERLEDINVILTGSDKMVKYGINVISYDLLSNYRRTIYPPDFMICDESHYLKNSSAARTKKTINIAKTCKTLFLSGTPLPNGRPTELFPILKNCAPDVIDNMGGVQFERRFLDFTFDRFGYKIIKGPRNEKEFYNRLTASGFMIRRLKKDVLPQLPEKIHKLVVMETDQTIRKIIEKEKHFDIEEIERLGPTRISGLPEIRRELAVATAPVCIGYIRELLEGGTGKIVIGAHHRELIIQLEEGLLKYRPVVTTGSTSPRRRDENVRRFQDLKSDCRVFIGNLQAAGTGITLTAANEIVLAEPDWVPGANEQFIDRVHRIGQTRGVIAHYLCIKGSLSFKILKRHLEKSGHIKEVLRDD